jgi:tRNA (guanine-N7-)-methyltransferase
LHPAAEASPRCEILVKLKSIVEPLDVGACFDRRAPVEIELGSGDGGFLMQYAQRHPERNFLGVERLRGRLGKLERKAPRLGLTNVRGLRIEAAYLLEYLLPAEAVAALHVYFPDPWPKKRHRARRLVNDRFPGLAGRALVPGGWVHLRTDDADYFEQMQAVFTATSGFEPAVAPAELCEVPTDFERVFAAEGRPIFRASYRKRIPAPTG